MVVSTKALDALKSMKLNLYERKLYVALLSRGVATAGELSDIAKVPRSRAYDILDSLAEKGFIVPQPGRPIKYVALAPRDAFERHKAVLERKFEEAKERVDRIANSDVMKELEEVYERGMELVQPYDMTGVIKGKDNIHQHLNALFKSAEKEVKIVTTERGLNDLYAKHLRVLKKLIKRGVKLKILAPESEGAPVETFKKIAEFKHVNNASTNLYNVDNKHVVLFLTDSEKLHKSQNVAFWAHSPHLASSVIEHFMSNLQ